MFSQLVFSAIFTLPIIASTAIFDSPDSTWSIEDDDTPPSNTDLTLNPSAPISFTQPLSPSGSDALLFASAPLPAISLSSSTTDNEIDTSDALLWNLDISSILASSVGTDETNELNLFSDDPFQLVDCSTSSDESLSTIDNTWGKSRLRQRDGSNKCTNPAGTPHMSTQSSSADESRDFVQKMYADSEFSWLVNSATENPDHNTVCYVLTLGKNPWGVCSSGQEKDQILLGGQTTIMDSHYTLWSLTHATNGTFPPFDSSFFIFVS